jgi:hypothetical protein
MLKLKNIIIFIAAAAILVLVYIFFIKPAPEENGLVSTSNSTTPLASTADTSTDALDTKDFLAVLLNVKNIKLDDSIFSDLAFSSLRDSSIVLTPDGTEGRANPFAPIGSDSNITPVNNPSTTKTLPAGAAATPPSVKAPGATPTQPTVN